MSIEWIGTAGAACAFLAAASGIPTRRGLSLMLVGVILPWLPALIHDFTVDMTTEKTRIDHDGSLRGERHRGGS